MNTNRQRIIDLLKTYPIRDMYKGELEINVEFESSNDSHDAFFKVIQFENVDAVCCSNKLNVYFDGDMS